jgi:zinc transporter ZupT
MSLKCFSTAVIFSVALIHLLGESLEVLSKHQELILGHSEEEGHDEHEEDHRRFRRFLEEDEHHEEEGHGHAFPLGLTLCCAGAVITLGVHLLTHVIREQDPKEDVKQLLASVEPESSNAAQKPTIDIELGSASKASVAAVGEACSDPYRLEPDHAHSPSSNVQCHSEHSNCDQTVDEASSNKQSPGNGGDIHRHVAITYDTRERSVMKSIILEVNVAVHSVIIGVSVGSMSDYTELGAFLAAISFHQLFEGISVGTASLEASYDWTTNFAFMTIFVLALPLGIIMGINIPATDMGAAVQACFSCVAAGSLIYAALVEMLASDFSHVLSIKGANNTNKIAAMFGSFVAGCTCMAVLAQWA